MSESLTIKSLFGDYRVEFSDNPAEYLHNLGDSGFFLVDARIRETFPDLLDGLSSERTIEIAASEHAKEIDAVLDLIELLVGKGLRRGDRMVAVGGGVVQDVAGFAASIIYRGVDWVYVPTTLAAQADSCIGSKTSINLRGFKNLLGNFNPPALVVNSPIFLETLPADEIRSGIGEILHFFLIDDSPLTEQLVDEYDQLFEEPSRLERYIAESLAIKKKTIEIDEFDQKERRVLNYGHTFGHPLESVSGYGVPHGQAVTRGMDMANYISRELGYLSDGDYRAMRDILRPNIPPYLVPDSKLDDYMEALSRDKKNREGRLGCILTRGPGDMFFAFVPLDEELRTMLQTYFMESRERGKAGA